MMKEKRAVIIGAGPAGLTAAYELLAKTDVKPIILEATGMVGGISKTINYKGNRIDIGGHRFFSKSDTVMDWWLNMLPVQTLPGEEATSQAAGIAAAVAPAALDPERTDKLMLIRHRLSRIFYLRKFFNYPVALNFTTIKNLGLWRMMKIGFSYLKTRLFPIREERSLEDFFINRFGRELYLTFFKDYTEKVWGLPCSEISAEWGAQRVKGLSISKALLHALKSLVKKDTSLKQKTTETSLIERYLYPKFGPGQLWEEVARLVQAKGGEIHCNCPVIGLESSASRVAAVVYREKGSSTPKTLAADYVFSSMPVRDLIKALGEQVPAPVREVAAGLMYRDFMTVGLLLKQLKVKNTAVSAEPGKTPAPIPDLIPDTWIYIQERDVRVGRLQVFNNWSPYLVADRSKVWLGMEYFCNEGDELWCMEDRQFIDFAIAELAKIEIIDKEDVLDGVLIRQEKTYPAYFGTYSQFGTIRNYTDAFSNLFLIGRNGMHKYNNMDHSMLTAIAAVENIIEGISTKDNLWSINTEEDYHEEKKT